MPEAYAFIAAFAVQIVLVSLLQPAWLVRYARAKAEAQLPGLDQKRRERFLALYRAANAVVAVIGLGLSIWLFNHMRGPNWNLALVSRLLSGYASTQMLPLVILSLVAMRVKKAMLMRSPPVARRTASLERQGIFDIVPPFVVFLAALAYALFVALVIIVRQYPVPGFTGYASLGWVTFVYAVNAICVYWLLYHRKRWPLETRAYRAEAVTMQIRLLFYLSLVAILFLSLRVALNLLHLQKWLPFVASIYTVIIMLCISVLFSRLRRQAEADRKGAGSASQLPA